MSLPLHPGYGAPTEWRFVSRASEARPGTQGRQAPLKISGSRLAPSARPGHEPITLFRAFIQATPSNYRSLRAEAARSCCRRLRTAVENERRIATVLILDGNPRQPEVLGKRISEGNTQALQL